MARGSGRAVACRKSSIWRAAPERRFALKTAPRWIAWPASNRIRASLRSAPKRNMRNWKTSRRTAALIVVLDGVEDPHNLGAIIRTAHAAGAGAVVVAERRAAGLTETVAKAAAGALEHLPVVRATNINQTLRSLKDMGYFVYGLDERGETTYDAVKFADHAVIVMGGEGKGLHDLVKRNCDMLVRIPMAGKIASLNVSVAAGITLFAWNRTRPSAT